MGHEGPPDRVESPFSFPEGSGERLVGPLPGERGGARGALITRTTAPPCVAGPKPAGGRP